MLESNDSEEDDVTDDRTTEEGDTYQPMAVKDAGEIEHIGPHWPPAQMPWNKEGKRLESITCEIEKRQPLARKKSTRSFSSSGATSMPQQITPRPSPKVTLALDKVQVP